MGSTETATASTSEQQHRSLRAVVCDDDPMARMVVGDLLAESGFDVVAEVDLAPAVIEVARVARPDVIVLDHALMGMTGIEALPALRDAAPGAALVVFSSFDAGRLEALGAGATAFVDKTHPNDLQAALRAIADQRRS